MKHRVTIILFVVSSELEETLLVLPFHFVITLLHLMELFVEKSADIELSQRIVGFLLRLVILFLCILFIICQTNLYIAITYCVKCWGFFSLAVEIGRVQIEVTSSVCQLRLVWSGCKWYLYLLTYFCLECFVKSVPCQQNWCCVNVFCSSIHHSQIIANKIDLSNVRSVLERRAQHLLVSIFRTAARWLERKDPRKGSVSVGKCI